MVSIETPQLRTTTGALRTAIGALIAAITTLVAVLDRGVPIGTLLPLRARYAH
jgi:hypothetical protein